MRDLLFTFIFCSLSNLDWTLLKGGGECGGELRREKKHELYELMYINISKLDYKRYWGHGPGIRILYNLSLHIEKAVQKYQK